MKKSKALDNRFIYFVDDNIIGVPRRAKELFKAFTPLKLGWASQVTINFARDQELMRLARESGCYGVFIGFETFSNQSIRDAGKGVNRPDEYLRDIGRIHAAGIKVWGSFIFGFDNDSLDVFRETLSFIEKSGMEFAQFSLLTPLPGTALFRQFEEEQRIVHRDWSKYDLGSIVFHHPLVSAQRLHFEKNHAWRRFYSIRSIMRRLGMPKSRGDLILWIANLAVNGALNYRWGKDYWKWKGRDSGLLTQPIATVHGHLVKVHEQDRLVKAAAGGQRSPTTHKWCGQVNGYLFPRGSSCLVCCLIGVERLLCFRLRSQSSAHTLPVLKTEIYFSGRKDGDGHFPPP